MLQGQQTVITLNVFVCFQDAMQVVTRVAIRDARMKEIRQELLNSKKLRVRGINTPHFNIRIL